MIKFKSIFKTTAVVIKIQSKFLQKKIEDELTPGSDFYNLLVEIREDPMSKSCNDCERLFTAEHKKGQAKLGLIVTN